MWPRAGRVPWKACHAVNATTWNTLYSCVSSDHSSVSHVCFARLHWWIRFSLRSFKKKIPPLHPSFRFKWAALLMQSSSMSKMWKTESGHCTTLPALQVDQNSTWKDQTIYRPGGTVLCYAVSFKAAGKNERRPDSARLKVKVQQSWKSKITAAEKHRIKLAETVSPIFCLSIIYLSIRIILVHFLFFHFGRFEFT